MFSPPMQNALEPNGALLTDAEPHSINGHPGLANRPPLAERTRTALHPAAQPHLERMGEQVVAREDADAVVEAAGEAGLHLDAVAMLAVPHVAGVRKLV